MQTLLFIPLLIMLPYFSKGQEASGIIVDQHSRKPIPFAHIVNTSNYSGAVSTGEGFFSMMVRDLDDRFKVTSIGYRTAHLNARALLAFDTIALARQVRILTQVEVEGSSISPEERLKVAYKWYLNQPSTKDRVFQGIYEEIAIDSVNRHTLQGVFVMKNYDNQQRWPLLRPFDHSVDFVLLALRMNKAVESPTLINGLRWVTENNNVRNKLGFGGLKDDVKLDSITQDGESLLYWMTAVNRKWGDQLHIVVDDQHRIRYIEDVSTFCSKLVFDPDVSFQYPVYASAYVPARTYNHRDKTGQVSESFFKILLIEELQAFDYPQDNLMPGKKLYDKEAKNMWLQKPLFEEFDWKSLEALGFEL